MASIIGLPTLFIVFEAAAQQVANRAKSGVAAVIVRDAQAQGVYTLRTESQIPDGLGEANKTHIKTAFIGSDRGAPSKVVLLVIPTETGNTTALEDGLKLIEAYQIDYLAGPLDVTDEELTVLNEWVINQRSLYRTVKLVRPFKTAGSDNMGIIELDESGLKDAAGAVTAGAFCARLAGILAGVPMGMSATYAAVPELTAVTQRTTGEQISAVNDGKLILIHDGLQAKIARGVNSLTTIPPEGKADWCKIKIVEGMDLIAYYLRTTIETSYMGRYPNTYDNKQLLVAAILDYLQYLERAGVLNPGESYAEIDYDSQLSWVNEQGVDTSDMTEQEVLEYQTGSAVFLLCGGRLVDAMEDFAIRFNNL